MPYFRKTAEILMALYVGLFGGFLALHAANDGNALAWTGFTLAATNAFAWQCMGAATIHSFGIRLNGRWRWSPLIRVVGILCGAVLFLQLAWAGSYGASSAGYTYAWIGMGFIAALHTALRDSYLSWRNLYGHLAN